MGDEGVGVVGVRGHASGRHGPVRGVHLTRAGGAEARGDGVVSRGVGDGEA